MDAVSSDFSVALFLICSADVAWSNWETPVVDEVPKDSYRLWILLTFGSDLCQGNKKTVRDHRLEILITLSCYNITCFHDYKLLDSTEPDIANLLCLSRHYQVDKRWIYYCKKYINNVPW